MSNLRTRSNTTRSSPLDVEFPVGSTILDGDTPTNASSAPSFTTPTPQVRTFYFVQPASTASVDFEPATLPLLFSPLEVYKKYYVAMRRLHSRKGPQLERLNVLYMQARECYKEGHFMAAVDVLQEACLRRRELFVASDFQVCMAYEHVAWAALHLAMIRLAEASSFPEGKGVVERGSGSEEDDDDGDEDSPAGDGDQATTKKKKNKGRMYYCSLAEVPALFSACEQLMASCTHINSHVEASLEKEWVVGGGLPSFGASTTAVSSSAADSSVTSNRTARYALIRATSSGASKITLPNRTLLQFTLYHNWCNYWITRKRWRTALKHACLAEERFATLLNRGWVSVPDSTKKQHHHHQQQPSNMDSISAFRTLLRLRTHLTQIRSETSNECIGHGALPGSLFAKPSSCSTVNTTPHIREIGGGVKKNKKAAVSSSSSSAMAGSGSAASTTASSRLETCFQHLVSDSPLNNVDTTAQTRCTGVISSSSSTSSVKLVSISKSKEVTESSVLVHSNLLPDQFPVVLNTKSTARDNNNNTRPPHGVDDVTGEGAGGPSSLLLAPDVQLSTQLIAWLGLEPSSSSSSKEEEDEEGEVEHAPDEVKQPSLHPFSTDDSSREALHFIIFSPDIPEYDPNPHHHRSTQQTSPSATNAPSGGGGMSMGMTISCTSPYDAFAKPTRWSIVGTLIPFYYNYVSAVSQIAILSGGLDRAWRTQRRKATLGLAHLAACAEIVARDVTPLVLDDDDINDTEKGCEPVTALNGEEEDKQQHRDGDDGSNNKKTIMVTSVNPIWWEKGVLTLRANLLRTLEATKEMERTEKGLYATIDENESGAGYDYRNDADEIEEEEEEEVEGDGGGENTNGSSAKAGGGSLHPVLAAQRNASQTDTRNGISITVSRVMLDYVMRERAQKRRLKEEARLRRLMMEDEEGDAEAVDGIPTDSVVVVTANNTASPSSFFSTSGGDGIIVRCKWMLDPTIEETRGLIQDIVSAPSSGEKFSGRRNLHSTPTMVKGQGDLASWWGGGSGSNTAPAAASNVTTTTETKHDEPAAVIRWPSFLQELHHIPASWKRDVTAIKALPYYTSLLQHSNNNQQASNTTTCITEEEQSRSNSGGVSHQGDKEVKVDAAAAMVGGHTLDVASLPPSVSAAALFIAFREQQQANDNATASATSPQSAPTTSSFGNNGLEPTSNSTTMKKKNIPSLTSPPQSSSLSVAQQLDMGRSRHRERERFRKHQHDIQFQKQHLLIPLSKFQNNNNSSTKAAVAASKSANATSSLLPPITNSITTTATTTTNNEASSPVPAPSGGHNIAEGAGERMSGGMTMMPPARDPTTGNIVGWNETEVQEEEGEAHGHPQPHPPEDVDGRSGINVEEVAAADDAAVSNKDYDHYDDVSISPRAASRRDGTNNNDKNNSNSPPMLRDVAAAALRAKAAKRQVQQRRVAASVAALTAAAGGGGGRGLVVDTNTNSAPSGDRLPNEDGCSEQLHHQQQTPPDIFALVHASLVDTVIALKARKHRQDQAFAAYQEKLQQRELQQQLLVEAEEEENRRYHAHQQQLQQQQQDAEGAAAVAVPQREEGHTIGAPDVSDGGKVMSDGDVEGDGRITNADNDDDVSVAAKVVPPLLDAAAVAEAAQPHNHHQDEEVTSSTVLLEDPHSILGRLRRMATHFENGQDMDVIDNNSSPTYINGPLLFNDDGQEEEDIHRCSLFELSAMPYSRKITVQREEEEGSYPPPYDTTVMSSATEGSTSFRSVSATSRRRANTTTTSAVEAISKNSKSKMKLAAATGFAATLMRGPYKLRPALNRPGCEDGGSKAGGEEEDDDEYEEENEEDVLQREARPSAIIPSRRELTPPTFTASYHQHRRLPQPSSILILGGGGHPPSSPSQRQQPATLAASGASMVAAYPPASSSTTTTSASGIPTSSTSPPRFPPLVKPPPFLSKGGVNSSSSLSPLRNPTRGGGVMMSSSPVQGHEVDDVDLEGIVPKVKALLARQDTLRTMMLTLSGHSDGPLNQSISAELRGNEASVAALRRLMHEKKRRAAAIAAAAANANLRATSRAGSLNVSTLSPVRRHHQ